MCFAPWVVHFRPGRSMHSVFAVWFVALWYVIVVPAKVIFSCFVGEGLRVVGLRVKGQETRVKGQESRDKGQETRDKSQETRDKGSSLSQPQNLSTSELQNLRTSEPQNLRTSET